MRGGRRGGEERGGRCQEKQEQEEERRHYQPGKRKTGTVGKNETQSGMFSMKRLGTVHYPWMGC